MNRVAVDLKPCLHCRVPMVRKRYREGPRMRLEKPAQYRARQFCDKRCEGAERQKKTRRRFCFQCGIELQRKRRPSGKLESIRQFRRRRWCDETCWQLWRGDHPLQHVELIKSGLPKRRKKKLQPKRERRRIKKMKRARRIEKRKKKLKPCMRDWRIAVCLHGVRFGKHCGYCFRLMHDFGKLDDRTLFRTPAEWATLIEREDEDAA